MKREKAGAGFSAALAILLAAAAGVSPTGSVAFAQTTPSRAPALARALESYVRPLVLTNNFSGTVLIEQDGQTLYQGAFGWSDLSNRHPNMLRTRFHIASMSMQFTAAAGLRLVDAGKLSLDTPVSDIVPDFPNGQAITIRHLLTQTSGIADINDLPEYDEILKSHQEPEALVAKVSHLPPRHAPGEESEGEEHSAYNLLALIIERKTGLPFASAVRTLVFDPLGMNDSGIDDDRPIPGTPSVAAGKTPRGVFALEPTDPIHWSAKAGNASAYSTVLDEKKWLDGLFRGSFLSAPTRAVMFALEPSIGYGWFKAPSKRLETLAYLTNGRSPGFASSILHLPEQKLSVVVLSNIYASIPSQMAADIAAIALNKPYDPIKLRLTPLDPAARAELNGDFRFGKDFYQPNAVVQLAVSGEDVVLRWPSGDISPLIPVDELHFIDRAYWTPVELIRTLDGRIHELKFGRFSGKRVVG